MRRWIRPRAPEPTARQVRRAMSPAGGARTISRPYDACLAVVLAFVSLAVCAPGAGASAPRLERFDAAGADGLLNATRGPDGAVWFTWRHGVGRVADSGSVTLRQ